jgi:hypothetical protein
VPAGHLPLTGLDVPGSAGVPVGLQSGPEVQAPLEPCVAVGAGETGAPPPVVLGLAGVVCVTDVVVVVAGLLLVTVEVAGPVVVDEVVVEDLLCLWTVVVDELWLDPPHAVRANASTTTAAATTATRARSPEHGVRCMS